MKIRFVMKRFNKYQNVPDAVLIEGYLTGNNRSFETLLERYRFKLTAYFFHRLGDWEIAEDLTQDVIEIVINKLHAHQYSEEGKFGAWVFGIAKKRLITELKRRKREVTASDEMAETIEDSDFNAEQKMISRQRNARLKAARKHLSARQHREIQLRYDEGKKHKEIAKIMHISEARSRTLCRDALNALRKKMGEDGEI
jgi:RNA polymerase sigma-70 factor, ECF subfamily